MAGSVVSAQTPERSGGARWLDRLLEILRAWWLLAVCSGAMLLLLGAGLLFPQIPGQIGEDPVATARWLHEWVANYGALGAWWRTLGLFAVLTSPLFQILAALLLILAAIHLADGVALILAFRRLPNALHADAGEAGAATPIIYPRALYRRRTAAPQPPDQMRTNIEHFLSLQVGRIAQAAVSSAPPSSVGSAVGDPGVQTPVEWRWLLLRHLHSVWLRPLLFGGLLLALVSLWLVVHRGWAVIPVPLAPGESYTYPPHEVSIEYGIQADATALASRPVLTATIAGESATLAVGAERAAHVAGADVRLTAGPPALWVEAPGALLLAPGGLPDEARSGLGLLFPQPGSEQIVVLASREAGLRVVRMADSDAPGYLVEVYEEGNVQPSQRLQVTSDQRVTMDVDGGSLELRLTPLLGVQVAVSRRPGLWLLWLGLALAVIGAFGYLRRPGFVLVQLAPWPMERSVLIVQSNRPTEIPATTVQ